MAWLDVALLASDLFLGVAETLFQLQLSIVVLLSKSVRMRSVGQLDTGLGSKKCLEQPVPRAWYGCDNT